MMHLVKPLAVLSEYGLTIIVYPPEASKKPGALALMLSSFMRFITCCQFWVMGLQYLILPAFTHRSGNGGLKSLQPIQGLLYCHCSGLYRLTLRINFVNDPYIFGFI